MSINSKVLRPSILVPLIAFFLVVTLALLGAYYRHRQDVGGIETYEFSRTVPIEGVVVDREFLMAYLYYLFSVAVDVRRTTDHAATLDAWVTDDGGLLVHQGCTTYGANHNFYYEITGGATPSVKFKVISTNPSVESFGSEIAHITLVEGLEHTVRSVEANALGMKLMEYPMSLTDYKISQMRLVRMPFDGATIAEVVAVFGSASTMEVVDGETVLKYVLDNDPYFSRMEVRFNSDGLVVGRTMI